MSNVKLFEPGVKIRYLGGEYSCDDCGFIKGSIYTTCSYMKYTSLDWVVCIENDRKLINHDSIRPFFELVVEETPKKVYSKEDKGWGF